MLLGGNGLQVPEILGGKSLHPNLQINNLAAHACPPGSSARSPWRLTHGQVGVGDSPTTGVKPCHPHSNQRSILCGSADGAGGPTGGGRGVPCRRLCLLFWKPKAALD